VPARGDGAPAALLHGVEASLVATAVVALVGSVTAFAR